MSDFRGLAALPTILLIGGIIVEIAIAGVFISYLLSQSGFGAKLSAEALAAAQAGVQDALMKIVRDKTFSSSSGYDITVGSRNARVVVCKDSKTVSSVCDTYNPGKDEITSIGAASLKKRQLQAIVNVNATSGAVEIESIREIAL